MADRGDTHYHVPSLNRWFAFGSVLLLIASIWMVIDDWNAPWKPYQAEFRRIEAERTRQALATEAMQAQMAEAAALEQDLQAAQARLDSKRAEQDQLEADLFAEKGVLFTLAETTKKAKQELAWERFLIEEHRVHYDDPSYGVEKLEESLKAFQDLEGQVELQNAKVAELEQRSKDLIAEVSGIDSQIKGATKDVALLDKKLDGLDPDSASKKLANIIRDFPGLDFIGPRNKVQKQVLADLTF
jgi:multidrug efflux pump subunit AcrA (membrane-fusion protein)